MNLRSRDRIGVLMIGVMTVGLAAAATSARAARAPAAQSAHESSPKMASQVFKNIQVLKDIPADQLIPTMQFIAASLGVECEYCHVESGFEKDDKETKQTARRMMRMMFAINRDNFDGHREVTCNSCHRGATRPSAIPAVASVETEPSHGASVHGMALSEPEGKKSASAAALPTADEILSKYAETAGGAAAFAKVSSRVEKGNIEAFGGHFPIEVYAKAPDKRMSVMHTPRGESITAFDGHTGWLRQGDRAPREMSVAEDQAAGLDATFDFPVRVRHIFKQFRVWPAEEVNGRLAYLVGAMRPGQPLVKLYFDEQSGLLVREVRYAETALGWLPTQIDYADYRDADGLKLPFRWTLARPNGAFTIQVSEVQQNVTIDDAKFAEPQAPAAKPEPSAP